MEKQVEVWKDIPGYEKLYQASTFSRFRSLDRIVKNNGNTFRTEKGKILKKQVSQDGYCMIRIRINNKEKRIRTHRLIAKTFIPNPNNLPIVEHKDDNPLNDSINNLMWSTIKANNINSCYRSNKHLIKPITQYDLKGNFIAEFASISYAYKALNKNPKSGTIGKCCNNKAKTAYGFIWRYKDN
jgi:NUMOD4 motif/HNH endonuclease/NUMOD1 domain